MSNLKYWVWLSELKGLKARSRLALISYFGSPENIYYSEKDEHLLVPDVSREQLALLDDRGLSRADDILGECTRLGARVITLADPDYPERLRNIYSPPCLLYVKGTWLPFDDEAAIAVVGTRSATPYGIQCAETIGYELGKGGAVVVSGLAKGCDSAAQRGALRAGGFVAGVLGCGLDVVYPRESEYLYEDVASHGALVTEYPPGTAANAEHFPARNRIISGLSLATVVVEADLRSGAMITAREATDQGRDVFAVPGPIGAEYSKGCNRLIQEGAELVTEGWDVLCAYVSRYPTKLHNAGSDVPDDLSHEDRAQKDDGKKPKTFDNTIEIEYIDIKSNSKNLTDDQIKILTTLSDAPMYVDDIIETTDIPARRVLSALTVLEIENLVTQESGRRFSLHAVIKE